MNSRGRQEFLLKAGWGGWVLPHHRARLVRPRPQRRRRRIGRGIRGTMLAACVLGGTGLWLLHGGSDPILASISLQTPPYTGYVVIDERAGRAIVAGAGRGNVSIIATDTGRFVHTTVLGGGSLGLAVVATAVEHVFVPSWAGKATGPGDALYMLDTRTGTLLRTITIPFDPLAVGKDGRGTRIFVASAGGMKANSISFQGVGVVSMLDARSGTMRWHARVGVHPTAVAVDATTRRVFVVNAGQMGSIGLGPGSVSMLDTETGRARGTVPVGRGAVAVAVDDRTGRVFIANEESHSISVLDARSGVVLRTVPVGFATALAVDEKAGRVIVANGGSGTVSVLDAATGAIVRTILVGGGPTAVAVDTRTHRAFITSTGGASRAVPHRLPRVLSGLVSLFVAPHAQTYVSVLDTRSGALLRDVHIRSGVPREIAIDQRTGHAFVTTPDSNGVTMFDATR